MQTALIPQWLDNAPGVDYSEEKALLAAIETWADKDGWSVSDGSELTPELRVRTDVLLEKGQKQVRLSVYPRRKRGRGIVRIDASNLRTAELVFYREKKRWRTEFGSIPVEDDTMQRGFDWLFSVLFKP